MYVIHDYGVWLANGSSTWKEVLSNICGIMYIFGYVFATLTKMRLSTGMQCIRVQHQMPCSRNIRHVMLWYPIILIRVYFSLSLYTRLVNALVLQSQRRLGENLRAILKAALRVLATVDKVRVVESKLDSTVDNVVNSLNTQHERVVLVADLVSP
jgi:hypothetical protein